MDPAQTAISAAVGATVAVVTVVVVNQIEKRKLREDAGLANDSAWYMKGWWEGREATLLQQQQATPQDFTATR